MKNNNEINSKLKVNLNKAQVFSTKQNTPLNQTTGFDETKTASEQSPKPYFSGTNFIESDDFIESDNDEEVNKASDLKHIIEEKDLENNALSNLLNAVKGGTVIPAFDVDNTLSIINSGRSAAFAGFNLFKELFAIGDSTSSDELIEGLIKTNRHLNVNNLKLQLKQIALNYPAHNPEISFIIDALDNYKDSNISFVQARNVIKALREKNSDCLPQDLFIAPLAKEFLNQVKAGKQKQIIIASVYELSDSSLKMLFNEAFGKEANKSGCAIYLEASSGVEKDKNRYWKKVTLENGGELSKNFLEKGGDSNSAEKEKVVCMMKNFKTHSLKILYDFLNKEKSEQEKIKIVHLDNDFNHLGEKEGVINFYFLIK